MAQLLLEEIMHLLLSHILYLNVWQQEPTAILSYLNLQDGEHRTRWATGDSGYCGVQIDPGHIQSPVQWESVPFRKVLKRQGTEPITLTIHLLIEQKL
jgi:hypothetical protein